MNILLLCNKFPYPAHDGSAQAIVHTVRCLHEAGHSITVLALNTRKHPGRPHDLPAHMQQQAQWLAVDADTTPGWSGALRNLWSNSSYLASRFEVPAFRAALHQVVRSQSFDVVQLEGLYMAHYLPDLKGLPVVLRAHNVEHRIWQQQSGEEKNPWKRWYLKMQWKRLARWEEQVARSVSGIAAISAEDEAWFKLLNAQTTHVGVPFDCQLQFNTPAQPPQFHYLASFDWIPNLQGLMWFIKHVWPAFHQLMPDAVFHIAGRGLPQSWVAQLPPGVQYHGVVEDPKAFSAAHGILVVPLWVGSGVRIKVGQALGWGIPIISTTMGAEGYGLMHGQHFWRADDQEGWVQGMLQLATNPKLQATLSQNALGYADHHLSSAAIGAQFDVFYQSLRP